MPTLLNSYLEPRFRAFGNLRTFYRDPAGPLLAFSSTPDYDTNINRFDPATGEPLGHLVVEMPDIFDLQISPNPATGAMLHLAWDEADGPQTYTVKELRWPDMLPTPLRLESGDYHAALQVADGRVYVAAVEQLGVFDATTYELLRSFPNPFGEDTGRAAISPDGRWVAFASTSEGTVQVLDTVTGDEVQTLTPSELEGNEDVCLVFSPDSAQLLVTGHAVAACWDVATGELAAEFATGANAYEYPAFSEVTFSPNGRYWAGVHTTLGLVVYETKSGELLWNISPTPSYALTFSADSEELLFGYGMRVMRRVARTGETLRLDPPIRGLNNAQWLTLYHLPADAGLLAVSQFGGLLRLNAHTGQGEAVLTPQLRHCSYNSYAPTTAPDTSYVTQGGEVWLGRAAEESSFRQLLPQYGQLAALSSNYVAIYQGDTNNSRAANGPGLWLHYLDGSAPTLLTSDPASLPTVGLGFVLDSLLLCATAEALTAWDVARGVPRWRRQLPEPPHRLFSFGAAECVVLGIGGALAALDTASGEQRWTFDLAGEYCQGIFYAPGRVLCLLNTGVLCCLDAASGQLLHREVLGQAAATATLSSDHRLYVIFNDTSLAHYDLRDWLGEGSPTVLPPAALAEPEAVAPFELPEPGLPAAELLAQLRTASWAGFDWALHAAPLRALLQAAEVRDGVGELHHFCTSQLQALSQQRLPFFKLIHRHGHLDEIVAVGLRPDGRYLATGSWLHEWDGDDYGRYDRGGELMLWEVATGRCVNILSPIQGGVGWYKGNEYLNSLQWTADGTALGLNTNTNVVAQIEPFAERTVLTHAFDVTYGWPRPPQWCWHPEGKAVYIACWAGTEEIPGWVAPTVKGEFPADEPYAHDELGPRDWFSDEELEERVDGRDEGSLTPLLYFESMGWSTHGYLFGNDGKYAYTLDPQTRALGAVIKDVQSYDIWSPNGDYFVRINGPQLDLYDRTAALRQSLPVVADLTRHLSATAADLPALGLTFDGAGGLLHHGQPVRELGGTVWFPGREQSLMVAIVWGHGSDFLVFYRDLQLLGTCLVPAAARPRQLADANAMVFSPDGQRFAVLSAERQVRLLDVADGLREVARYDLEPDTEGILLGADDRLIALMPRRLRFYEASTGRAISTWDNSLLEDEPEALPEHSPLAEYARQFPVDPFFPLQHDDEIQWLGAFATGLVVSPPALRAHLDEELTFSVGNRLAWPYRWATPHEVPTLLSALDAPALPLPTSARQALRAELSA